LPQCQFEAYGGYCDWPRNGSEVCIEQCTTTPQGLCVLQMVCHSPSSLLLSNRDCDGDIHPYRGRL